MNDPKLEKQILQLHGISMFRFVINWTAFVLMSFGITSFYILGFPVEWIWQVKLLASCLFIMFLFIFANYVIPIHWKIEVDKQKLVFYGLCHRWPVKWSELDHIKAENWGQETFYAVKLKSGAILRFPEGLQKQEWLLSELREAMDENKRIERKL